MAFQESVFQTAVHNYKIIMHNILYLHKRMVRKDDLPIQKHKLSISLLKELIEVSVIFIIGSFSIKIWFHENVPL